MKCLLFQEHSSTIAGNPNTTGVVMLIKVAFMVVSVFVSEAFGATITYVHKLGQCILTASGKELNRKLPQPIHNEAIYAMLARPNVVVGFMDKRHGIFTSNTKGLHEDIVRLMRLEQEKQDAGSSR